MGFAYVLIANSEQYIVILAGSSIAGIGVGLLMDNGNCSSKQKSNNGR